MRVGVDGPVELPDKLFFKIGEVARLVGAEPYVLRYWESEFPFVRPRKSRGGQRLYRRGDVEALINIKRLLRDEGFTIAGARKQLAQQRAAARAGDAPEPRSDLAQAADQAQMSRLVDEIERLKEENRAAADAKATAAQRCAAREETLRQVRKEVVKLLDELG